MSNYAAIAALSPKHFWKLDETSGTTAADSGSAPVAGVYTNGPTINQSPIVKFANASEASTSLDGVDDFVNIPFSPNQTASSVCAWFKPSAMATSGVLFTSTYLPSAIPICVVQDASVVGGTSGRMAVGCYTGSAWNYVQTPAGYAAGDPMFIVGTAQSGGSVAMWLNGKKIGTAACGTFTPPTTATTRIGRRWDNPNYAKGLTAGVALWDRILSDAEVATLFALPPNVSFDGYLGGAAGSTPSPWMPFGEHIAGGGGGGGGGTPPTTGQLWPRGNLP